MSSSKNLSHFIGSKRQLKTRVATGNQNQKTGCTHTNPRAFWGNSSGSVDTW